MKPHKHAEVLRAIADGKEVEFFNAGRWRIPDLSNPISHPDWQWRVKPEKIEVFILIHEGLDAGESLRTYRVAQTKSEGSFFPQIKLTLDGDTREPIAAEVIR